MSNELSMKRAKSAKSMRDLGQRVDKVQDMHLVGNVSWHLYSGLYQVVYRMGQFESTDVLGWKRDQAAQLLGHTYFVAGQIDEPRPIHRPSNHFRDTFTRPMMQLTERLDAQEVPLTDLRAFNASMVEGYASMVESNEGMGYLAYHGLAWGVRSRMQQIANELRPSFDQPSIAQ